MTTALPHSRTTLPPSRYNRGCSTAIPGGTCVRTRNPQHKRENVGPGTATHPTATRCIHPWWARAEGARLRRTGCSNHCAPPMPAGGATYTAPDPAKHARCTSRVDTRVKIPRGSACIPPSDTEDVCLVARLATGTGTPRQT